MKIKEFLITRYGPLPDTRKFILGKFNLFFGKNEDGKTLMIDALVKLLLGRNAKAKVFNQIKRVDEDPVGYVIIEVEKGNEKKLPEEGKLTEFTGLTPSECRNIFIIRNSDLSIIQENEFYTDVTDRLTGLRTKEIYTIKEKLQENGKLTRPDSGASLSDKAEWGNIRTRLEKADELITNIDELKNKIKNERYEEFEEKIYKLSETIDQINENLNLLENAQKRKEYEKGYTELEKLRKALKILNGLNLEYINKLKSRINNYNDKWKEFVFQKPKNEFFAKAMIISLILLLFSILGVIIRPIRFLYYLPILFSITTSILAFWKLSYMNNRIQLNRESGHIKDEALKLNVGGKNIEKIIINIEEFEKNLKLKNEAEVRLDSYFDSKSEDLKENIPYWEDSITVLKEYKEKAKDTEYDENLASQLKKDREEKLKEKKELQNKMKDFHEDLKELEKEANRILQLEGDYLNCDTSVDLNEIRDQLMKFIDKIEKNKNNVLEVMAIFEEIETEEKEKVSKLFGRDSLVSEYFKEITNGLYKEVFFSQEKDNIEVKLRDGKILDVKKLIGGAYDQLYLSIRIALGEKLLKGNKGFFIMDDPFVKADQDRLKRQIEILKNISESGWQILYFSAKGEVINVLNKDIKNGKVNYIEVKSIYA